MGRTLFNPQVPKCVELAESLLRSDVGILDGLPRQDEPRPLQPYLLWYSVEAILR